MSTAEKFVKICTINGKEVYAKGMLVRFGRAKGKPLEEHEKWHGMSKGQRRALRKAAFRAGNRRLAHRSVNPE